MLQQTQVDRERDELLLRPVVQVAFDLAPFSVLRFDQCLFRLRDGRKEGGGPTPLPSDPLAAWRTFSLRFSDVFVASPGTLRGSTP